MHRLFNVPESLVQDAAEANVAPTPATPRTGSLMLLSPRARPPRPPEPPAPPLSPAQSSLPSPAPSYMEFVDQGSDLASATHLQRAAGRAGVDGVYSHFPASPLSAQQSASPMSGYPRGVGGAGSAYASSPYGGSAAAGRSAFGGGAGSSSGYVRTTYAAAERARGHAAFDARSSGAASSRLGSAPSASPLSRAMASPRTTLYTGWRLPHLPYGAAYPASSGGDIDAGFSMQEPLRGHPSELSPAGNGSSMSGLSDPSPYARRSLSGPEAPHAPRSAPQLLARPDGGAQPGPGSQRVGREPGAHRGPATAPVLRRSYAEEPDAIMRSCDNGLFDPSPRPEGSLSSVSNLESARVPVAQFSALDGGGFRDPGFRQPGFMQPGERYLRFDGGSAEPSPHERGSGSHRRGAAAPGGPPARASTEGPSCITHLPGSSTSLDRSSSTPPSSPLPPAGATARAAASYAAAPPPGAKRPPPAPMDTPPDGIAPRSASSSAAPATNGARRGGGTAVPPAPASPPPDAAHLLSITLNRSMDSAEPAAAEHDGAAPLRSAEHDTISEYAGLLSVPQSFANPSTLCKSPAATSTGDPSVHFGESSDLDAAVSHRSRTSKSSMRSHRSLHDSRTSHSRPSSAQRSIQRKATLEAQFEASRRQGTRTEHSRSESASSLSGPVWRPQNAPAPIDGAQAARPPAGRKVW
jgi:hypothetical protein